MLKRILAVGVLGIVVMAGVVGYSFFRPPEEASGPLEALPITVEEPELATAEPDGEAADPVGGDTDTTEELEATAERTTDTTESDDALTADRDLATFKILPVESEVRFVIDEVLNGSPKTVVGITDQIAGEIAVDVSRPANSRIGTILVNARTLTTDNEFRNRALKNRILDTNAHEFIVFTPAEIVGLPDSATVSESYAVQIVGDLTVRDVTNQVTFDATITPVSEMRLEGSASTTILYADYGLTIPDARSVSSVEDEVRLEIDFVAVAG